jgi:glycosyltransferase involved in cell wall biosynthesis
VKKVVILSAFLSPYRSGAEACVEEVALSLCDEFDITIVTAKGFSQEGMLGGKIPVVRVGLGLSIDKWLFPFLAPRAVRKIQPDVIHAILETFAGLALHRCRKVNAKRILTLQTTNRSFLKGMIIKSADKVTAISKALVKIAGKFGRDDVVLIPNGVQVSSFKFQAAKEKIDGRILFVGRLEKMKGIDILIKAFKKVSENNNEARLKIVGDGSQRKSLENLTSDLEIKDKITFTGKLSPNEVYEEYGHAQIFCGLSRSEAFGNVFIEAQCAGCAVIGTSIGGIPDTVEQSVTGLLVKPDDVESAVEALERLLSDTDLRNKLSENGRKNAEKYDWANIAQQYAELYS